MKNIFLLPTDEPSRLYLNMKGILSKDELKMRLKNQNINITSLEKIKKGDWFLDLTDNTLWKNETPESMGRILFPECKKIIITTDPKLIADGVQAIDDTFLEWFVKNPSCEFVKTELLNVSEVLWEEYFKKHGVYPKYPYYEKIIIPQEEPKQKPCDNCNNDACCCIIKKQETLEDIVKNYAELSYYNGDEVNAFVNGSKWQAEKDKNKYSEEEVRQIATWSFHFYKTNEFTDSELEDEWYKLLEKKFKNK
jgi:hypothetical protein